jgi:hypothetical protein
MLKLKKIRYEFGCGFCGAGGKKFVSVDDMNKAARNHSCRCSSIKKYEVRYYEGYAKPTSRELQEAN